MFFFGPTIIENDRIVHLSIPRQVGNRTYGNTRVGIDGFLRCFPMKIINIPIQTGSAFFYAINHTARTKGRSRCTSFVHGRRTNMIVGIRDCPLRREQCQSKKDPDDERGTYRRDHLGGFSLSLY